MEKLQQINMQNLPESEKTQQRTTDAAQTFINGDTRTRKQYRTSNQQS